MKRVLKAMRLLAIASLGATCLLLGVSVALGGYSWTLEQVAFLSPARLYSAVFPAPTPEQIPTGVSFARASFYGTDSFEEYLTVEFGGLLKYSGTSSSPPPPDGLSAEHRNRRTGDYCTSASDQAIASEIGALKQFLDHNLEALQKVESSAPVSHAVMTFLSVPLSTGDSIRFVLQLGFVDEPLVSELMEMLDSLDANAPWGPCAEEEQDKTDKDPQDPVGIATSEPPQHQQGRKLASPSLRNLARRQACAS